MSKNRIGEDCLVAAINKVEKGLEDVIQHLLLLSQNFPETKPLLARLITEHKDVLTDSFGALVLENSYGHIFDDFLSDIYFINQFVSHEILDDGSPGIGYSIGRTFCSPSSKEESCVSIFLREQNPSTKDEPTYIYPSPFICRSNEFADWIEPVTISKTIEVIDYHYKENLKRWAQYRASELERFGPDSNYYRPGTDHQNRINLAKDLGLVPNDFEYVMIDQALDDVAKKTTKRRKKVLKRLGEENSKKT